MRKTFSIRRSKASPGKRKPLAKQSDVGDGTQTKKLTEQTQVNDDQRNPPNSSPDWLEFPSNGSFRDSASPGKNHVKDDDNDDVLFNESGTDWMDRVISKDIMGGNQSNTTGRMKDAAATKKNETRPIESTSSSSDDDIFANLNIPADDEEVDIKGMLNNILTQSSQEEESKKVEDEVEATKKVPISLEAYMDLTASIDESNTSGKDDQNPDLLIDPSHLKNAKGILIYDPEKNCVYHMDEDNKSLTNKDLVILGRNEDVADDQTLMSNLTEVTYKKSKEERMQLIMDHLQKAAQTLPVPESSAWCGGWENPFHIMEPGEMAKKQDDRVTGTAANKGNNAQWDTSLLLRSIMALSTGGEKVDMGSFSEKVCVCITRIYLALQENPDDDIGLRCISKEPKLSHDLGITFSERLDGRAIVTSVIKGSTGYRSGVRVGDILSVSYFEIFLGDNFLQKELY